MQNGWTHGAINRIKCRKGIRVMSKYPDTSNPPQTYVIFLFTSLMIWNVEFKIMQATKEACKLISKGSSGYLCSRVCNKCRTDISFLSSLVVEIRKVKSKIIWGMEEEGINSRWWWLYEVGAEGKLILFVYVYPCWCTLITYWSYNFVYLRTYISPSFSLHARWEVGRSERASRLHFAKEHPN